MMVFSAILLVSMATVADQPKPVDVPKPKVEVILTDPKPAAAPVQCGPGGCTSGGQASCCGHGRVRHRERHAVRERVRFRGRRGCCG
jgi:hypothetical protein